MRYDNLFTTCGTAKDNNVGMKHMYTNPEPVCIDKLPEPFRTAVRQPAPEVRTEPGYEHNGCLATLFPKEIHRMSL